MAKTTGLYYTQIKIGSPPRDYYVCVDTGSDLFWVKCDKKDFYYPSQSKTAATVPCGHEFCAWQTCKTGSRCDYQMSYIDGSSSKGYIVTDQLQLNVVIGNFTTSLYSSNIVFGCGVHQSGSIALAGPGRDGVIGFGRSKMSLISQLMESGLVGKAFGHCFDGDFGGGIFILGQVDHPKMKTTPLIGDRNHYTVNMLSIDVGMYTLKLGTGTGIETTIDSGTTLAYFPEDVYEVIMNKIMANHHDLKLVSGEESHCFNYTASVDGGFPTITLHFEGSLQLVVYPHDYLFHYQDYKYCIGWRSIGSMAKGTQMAALLGELVLSNKFVLYDLQNEAIGWIEHDCMTSVGVYDQPSSAVYEVSSHQVIAPPRNNSATHDMGSVLILLVAVLCLLFLCQDQVNDAVVDSFLISCLLFI